MAVTIVAVGLVTIAGCVVVHKEEPCPYPVGWVPPAGVESEIAEIDAAGKLFSDNQKRDVYAKIAARPDLSCDAQVHLVNAAYRLFSDSQKEQVLLTLIRNPCLCEPAKVRILADLGKLFSDSAKKRILDAFNERPGPVMPVPQATEAGPQASTGDPQTTPGDGQDGRL